VELTEAGRALRPGTEDAFSLLISAWRSARRVNNTSSITVTAGPAFTAKWLAPRLYAFAQAYPDIELRFSAGLRMMDFERDEVDIAIRFGLGPDDGLFSTPIMREWVTPMMAPELAAAVKTPEDIKGLTLLHQDDVAFLNPNIGWRTWFKVHGLGDVPVSGPRFSQGDHAIDAALAGGGAVMGRISLAYKALREGRLVAPFGLSLRTQAHYRFLCPLGAETRPQTSAFLEWVREEAKDMLTFDKGRDFADVEDALSSD
jgi:LysR family glycine cleavage system transcriptional activator